MLIWSQINGICAKGALGDTGGVIDSEKDQAVNLQSGLSITSLEVGRVMKVRKNRRHILTTACDGRYWEYIKIKNLDFCGCADPIPLIQINSFEWFSFNFLSLKNIDTATFSTEIPISKLWTQIFSSVGFYSVRCFPAFRSQNVTKIWI